MNENRLIYNFKINRTANTDMPIIPTEVFSAYFHSSLFTMFSAYYLLHSKWWPTTQKIYMHLACALFCVLHGVFKALRTTNKFNCFQFYCCTYCSLFTTIYNVIFMLNILLRKLLWIWIYLTIYFFLCRYA